MAAHNILVNDPSFRLSKEQVSSYGTGSAVKLPGQSATTPNIYEFGTSYQQMIDDLKKKDEKFYTNNGLIPMMQRNITIKPAPEKFQKYFTHSDIIITFEDRVFETVVEEFNYRSSSSSTVIYHRPCHIINITLQDNQREAEKGAKLCQELVQQIEQSEDWENDILRIVYEFEKKYRSQLPNQRVLHLVLFL